MSGILQFLLHQCNAWWSSGVQQPTRTPSIARHYILVSHNQHQASTLAAIYDRILVRHGGLWICWDGEKPQPMSDSALTLRYSRSEAAPAGDTGRLLNAEKY